MKTTAGSGLVCSFGAYKSSLSDTSPPLPYSTFFSTDTVSGTAMVTSIGVSCPEETRCALLRPSYSPEVQAALQPAHCPPREECRRRLSLIRKNNWIDPF